MKSQSKKKAIEKTTDKSYDDYLKRAKSEIKKTEELLKEINDYIADEEKKEK